jgi:uncharacterized protein
MQVRHLGCAVINNPFAIGWLALYAVATGVLAWRYGFGPAEPLAVLVIFGLALPGLALLLTRGHAPRPVRVDAPAAESRLAVLCLLAVTAFLAFGLDLLHSAVPSRLANDVAVIAAKLLVFVALPYALLRRRGYRWRDFLGLRLGAREWLVAIVLSLAFVLVNAVIGQGPARIAASGYGPVTLAVGGIAVYLLLCIEVGLVEEFLFRAFLQARFATWLRSEVSGLFLAATLFGLAHAPGFYLRWEQNAADLFSEPSLLFALAYSIAVISVAGVFMGVVWLRTRSLAVVILVHAAGDWLPNVAGTLQGWGIAAP